MENGKYDTFWSRSGQIHTLAIWFSPLNFQFTTCFELNSECLLGVVICVEWSFKGSLINKCYNTYCNLFVIVRTNINGTKPIFLQLFAEELVVVCTFFVLYDFVSPWPWPFFFFFITSWIWEKTFMSEFKKTME